MATATWGRGHHEERRRDRGAGRGRSAEKPTDIPKRGWLDIVKRTGKQLSEDRISIIAAGVAFYGLLAVFPGLVALVSIYGLVFDPQQVAQQIEALGGMLPEEATKLVAGQLQALTSASGGKLGLAAIVGVLLALWSASAGVRTLMQALNVAYDEDEKRGTVRFYATALLLTLAAIVAAIVAIAVIVALPAAIAFLGLSSFAELLIAVGQVLLLAVLMIFGLAVVYRFGPSRHEPKWRWASAGAVLATVLWIVGSVLFGIYVRNFASYNETYGSLGAVVILLMWFLLTAYAVLIGAEMNAEMERQTEKDTTEGEPRRMGSRGAHAADTVAR